MNINLNEEEPEIQGLNLSQKNPEVGNFHLPQSIQPLDPIILVSRGSGYAMAGGPILEDGEYVVEGNWGTGLTIARLQPKTKRSWFVVDRYELGGSLFISMVGDEEYGRKIQIKEWEGLPKYHGKDVNLFANLIGCLNGEFRFIPERVLIGREYRVARIHAPIPEGNR